MAESKDQPDYMAHLNRKLVRQIHSYSEMSQFDETDPTDVYRVCSSCRQQIDRHPCDTILMLDYINDLEKDLKVAQRTVERSILPERH